MRHAMTLRFLPQSHSAPTLEGLPHHSQLPISPTSLRGCELVRRRRSCDEQFYFNFFLVQFSVGETTTTTTTTKWDESVNNDHQWLRAGRTVWLREEWTVWLICCCFFF
jgi:hypothetical protein